MATDKDMVEFGRLVAFLAARDVKAGVACGAVNDAMTLVKMTRGIVRHAENECNREVTPREIAADAKRCAAVEALAASYGLTVRYGDPRGYVVHLVGPGVRGNTWGGDESGYGVPS
jgi:hypothetical protein